MEQLFLSACETGSTSMVAKFIRKYGDINCTDSSGCTGLMKACLNGNYEIAKLLLEANANLNQKDFYNQNALHYAVRSNNEKLVKFLCSNKVDSEVKHKVTKLKPIDHSFVTVSKDITCKSKEEPEEKQYMKQARNIRRLQNYDYFFDDSNVTSEDRIVNILTRYKNLTLSDYESDEEEQKGDVYKKSKKKRKSKGKKGGSAKKGKSGKKGKKKK